MPAMTPGPGMLSGRSFFPSGVYQAKPGRKPGVSQNRGFAKLSKKREFGLPPIRVRGAIHL